MDPEVVRDPRYSGVLGNALRSLPTLSIVTDRQSFHELHANPRQKGREWERPASVEALSEMKGMSSHLAQRSGEELLAALREVDGMPDGEHRSYPRPSRDGGGRPTPEEEALANRIRDLRTRVAEEMELDRGVLLSNAQILEIVRADPDTPWDLEGVPGMRRWQARALGDRLLSILT